ncbi:MAG: hypothetical protein WDN66_04230 [Candidatus Saccharibacteria bacterium]
MELLRYVPVGIIVVLAAAQLLPKKIGEENKKIALDLPGATLATVGLMALVYGLSKAPTLTWSSAEVWSLLVAVLSCLFCLFSTRDELSNHLCHFRYLR